MMKPGTFLLLLVALGGVAGALLWSQKKVEIPAVSPDSTSKLEPIPAALAQTVKTTTNTDLEKQIVILEGQVEYLQGQVKALQDENAEMIQRLGTLGMKGQPMNEKGAVPPLTEGPEPPDYVTLGVDLLGIRKLQSVPMVITTAPQPVVEKAILASLLRRHPGDGPKKQSRALAALGVIPEPVDILPLKAALMVRQLCGWYEESTETLLLVEPTDGPSPPTDPVMAIAYGHLMREHGPFLIPSATGPRLSTDAQLAREGLLGGDAALTRFLYSIQKPVSVNASDIPPEDPDHPFNEVPMPIFLRELHLFGSSRGFEFAQSLHSAGDFKQINNAYGRPPINTAEIIDPELYLDAQAAPVIRIEWPDVDVLGAQPYWDDTLGKFATYITLRAHNPDEIAFDASKGWQTDRLLSYSADGKNRDHAVWQVRFPASGDARRFFKAMSGSLLQRYDQPAETQADENKLAFKTADRFVRLSINNQGTGVLLIDAATEPFLQAAIAKFDTSH